jgi:hypothetical protein
LAPERRDVFFGPCFAHQANLVVGEIFKESPNLINASEKAIQIITYLNRSVYFMARLRDEQKIKYNKYLALLLPCATRWNSHYHCYFSLIRTKAALKVYKNLKYLIKLAFNFIFLHTCIFFLGIYFKICF